MSGPISEPKSHTVLLAELVEKVELLDEHLIATHAEAAMLRHEVQTEKEKRRILAVFVAVVAAAVLALSVIAISVSFIARNNARTVREVRNQGHVIVECTTPDQPHSADPADRVHECYDQGVQRQAEAIQQIIDGIRASTTSTTTARP